MMSQYGFMVWVRDGYNGNEIGQHNRRPIVIK